MERVKKGEKYWYIASDFFAGDFYITCGVDFYEDIQDGRFAMGNYFHTKEEAESMTNKLRAVLKGVDVIEMPSIEEIINRLPHAAGYEQDIQLTGYRHGYCNCYDYVKSKIIK